VPGRGGGYAAAGPAGVMPLGREKIKKAIDTHENVCYIKTSQTERGIPMNEIEIVKTLAKNKKMSHAVLAEKMGMATPTGVSNRLQGRSMTVEVLVKMLEAMDCELIIKNKIGDKESWVVVNENRKGDDK